MHNERLIKYLSSHIPAINFIAEYQKKTLPVSILFYKVCSSFPKDKLGGMKGAFRHIQNDKLQIFKNILTEEEFKEVVKQQNNLRPKIGQYLEFITLSLLETCLASGETLVFPSAQEDIQEGWDFKFAGIKYDITTNLNKISRPGIKLLKIPLWEVIDQQNLLLPEAISFLAGLLTKEEIPLAADKLEYTKIIVGKVRSKYIEMFSHQVRLLPVQETVVVEKPVPIVSELIPPLNNQILPTEAKMTKLSTITLEDMNLLGQIQKLSPKQRQLLEYILQTWQN